MKNPTQKQVQKWNQTYYEKNKEKRKKQYTKYVNELRQWFRDLKKELKCSQCGIDHPAALSFHHTDPTTKEYTVAAMTSQGLAKATILKEIAKCIVLCHNCHAIHHYNERLLSWVVKHLALNEGILGSTPREDTFFKFKNQ